MCGASRAFICLASTSAARASILSFFDDFAYLPPCRSSFLFSESASPMSFSMSIFSFMSGNCPSRTRKAALFRISLASGPTVEADGSCPKALVCHGIRVVRGRRWDRDRGSPLVGGLPVRACRRPFSSSSTALPARGCCTRATQDSRSFAFNGRWHTGECEAVRPAGRVAICREAGRRATAVRVTPGGVRGRGRSGPRRARRVRRRCRGRAGRRGRSGGRGGRA